MKWYLSQIKSLAKEIKSSNNSLITSASRQGDKTRQNEREDVKKNSVVETTSNINASYIGKMLFFAYDPKTKDKLPYWDQFPLVFPLKMQKGGMLGINMHYLPPYERARLMTALYSRINTQKLDERSKLYLSYKILNESTKFRAFRPCIKRYLTGHFRSRLMVISGTEWNKVLLLPISNFMKMSEYLVWQASIDKIRNHK